MVEGKETILETVSCQFKSSCNFSCDGDGFRRELARRLHPTH